MSNFKYRLIEVEKVFGFLSNWLWINVGSGSGLAKLYDKPSTINQL